MGIEDYGFNAKKEIKKNDLEESTFDIVDVDRFHNTKFSTLFAYLMTWVLMFLSWVLLGTDVYTCLNILVFHRWSSDDVKPYAYSVAKWIFTGCIIFELCLLVYHWIWAIHTYRTKNIALAYVSPIARLLYVIRSYNYHCLFHKIEQDSFFDWACFLSYREMDGALQILVADTPRQVINILTLRFYATNGDLSNDIIANIKRIATTNLRLAIVLSFMCLSVAIWSIFFFIFVLGMLMYVPVIVKIRKRGFRSLKKYCCSVVNENVRMLVRKNHKPKKVLLEKGILNLSDINANPLLSSSTSTFSEGFQYRGVSNMSSTTLAQSLAQLVRQKPSQSSLSYNDNTKLHRIAKENLYGKSSQSYESLPLRDLNTSKPSNLRNMYKNPDIGESTYSVDSKMPENPFQDKQSSEEVSYGQPYEADFAEPRVPGKSFKKAYRKPPSQPVLINPFSDLATTRHDQADYESQHSSRSSDLGGGHPGMSERLYSQSSLTHERPLGREAERLHSQSTLLHDAAPYGLSKTERQFSQSSLTHETPLIPREAERQFSLSSLSHETPFPIQDNVSEYIPPRQLSLEFGAHKSRDASGHLLAYESFTEGSGGNALPEKSLPYPDPKKDVTESTPYPIRGLSMYGPQDGYRGT